MNYTKEVASKFNYEVINTHCRHIDRFQSIGDMATANMLKSDILHFIQNSCDLSSPLNKQHKKLYEKVVKDIQKYH